jgi:hypothetical protein
LQGFPSEFECCVLLSENRGVPGSSPGLAIAKGLQTAIFYTNGLAGRQIDDQSLKLVNQLSYDASIPCEIVHSVHDSGSSGRVG